MSDDRQYCVYIMTNQRNTVLYTGMSNEVLRRVHEHKIKLDPKSSTARYNINKLVYVETYDNAADAIIREKQIKNYSRRKKEELINNMNPEWRDLTEDFDDVECHTRSPVWLPNSLRYDAPFPVITRSPDRIGTTS